MNNIPLNEKYTLTIKEAAAYFNIGVKKIPYYFSGILMYINPTLQFLLGLFYFHEVFDLHRFIAFLIIWIGIAFTVYEKLRLIRTDSAQPENIS